MFIAIINRFLGNAADKRAGVYDHPGGVFPVNILDQSQQRQALAQPEACRKGDLAAFQEI